MLKCYKDEIEHIIAESPEEASAIKSANIGEEASSPEQFELVQMDKMLTIHSDDPEMGLPAGNNTMSVSEWINLNGRGVLCSTEW